MEAQLSGCSPEIEAALAIAIDRISEAYAESDRSEDNLVRVIQENLTDNDEVNNLILRYARTLVVSKNGRSD